jgi:leucyl aminopeptidase
MTASTTARSAAGTRTSRIPTITRSSTAGRTAKVDALVIGIRPAGASAREVIGAPAGLTPAGVTKLRAALDAVGASTGVGDVTRVPGEGITTAPLIIAVGLGSAAASDLETLRKAAGSAARSAVSGRPGAATLGLCLPASTPDDVEAITLGALLGTYRFTAFRGAGTKDRGPALRTLVLPGRPPGDAATRQATERAGIVGAAVMLARDLVNTPPSALPPAELARVAKDTCADLPIKVQVMDERALARGGYGGILGVGQGAAHPPRLVRLEYRVRRPAMHLSFVGKGITFDSGGLSLKPPQAMETMKCDMSGAAAVLAAITAIARLKLPVDVTGYMACAENMPSGTAQRPGDVLTMYGGRTVEVLNTDAEGRLVLADALVRAQEDEPDLIVDIATLTGAASIALGRRTAGVMGNDDEVRDAVWEASQRAGEPMWHMPIPEELRATIDSPIADIKNIGDRFGGMMVGAVFLREFIGAEQPWVHLDIAGPAFNEGSPFGYTPAGGTGSSVRTLIQLALDAAE